MGMSINPAIIKSTKEYLRLKRWAIYPIMGGPMSIPTVE